jgi:hypothetical protein
MVEATYSGATGMTVMQAVVEWARQTLNLEPPHMDSIPDDPIEEVERSIARGRRVNQLLINELHHHEKADVAQALLRSRDRATLP